MKKKNSPYTDVRNYWPLSWPCTFAQIQSFGFLSVSPPKKFGLYFRPFWWRHVTSSICLLRSRRQKYKCFISGKHGRPWNWWSLANIYVQTLNSPAPFDVITSIKSMESMECMYEKVSRYLTAYPVTLLRIPLPYVTFCGIHRNIM